MAYRKKKETKNAIVSDFCGESQIAGEINRYNFTLSDTDRITYIFKRAEKGIIVEVTCVSYEIYLEEGWVTILRFDSSHGSLHRHMVISLENLTQNIVSKAGVIRKGTHAKWLTWAIDEIKRSYEGYKKGFLKRSKSLTKNK